ncbi:D-glycerate 3-kinase [Myxozyma melibiosi]|uniref:D-glycerate 3-kinase n=1 Tax=Myxozyma melibiosi TaxID=54550 RepID=A0ABR1F9E7_9ASCO
MAKQIIDDKCPICIPFILKRLQEHTSKSTDPFFIGLNGVQGVGKTTLVTMLEQTLKQPPYSLPIVVLSIDDLYLTHADQVALASSDPKNPLIQHRGVPGTHDMSLAAKVFSALKSGTETKIPLYDKSQFNGQGDRAPESTWATVNKPGEPKIKVVLFEGWCVGFRALADEGVLKKREESVVAHEAGTGDLRSALWKNRPEDLLFINSKLREYDVMTDLFDAFVHVDAEKTEYVYNWRLQQEAELRERSGRGMTDEQVVEFVDGYYPAYELYTDGLRSGVIKGVEGAQLRMTVKEDRKVISSTVI